LICKQVTGVHLLTYLNTRIMTPIGAGLITASTMSSGHTKIAGNMRATAYQLARLGYLLLQKGQWNNVQVLKPEYVTMTTTHSATSDDDIWDNTQPTWVSHHPNTAPQKGYGWLWWTNRLQWEFGRSLPADAFAALGFSGNILLCVPSQQLIVVRIASQGPAGIDQNLHPQQVRDTLFDILF